MRFPFTTTTTSTSQFTHSDNTTDELYPFNHTTHSIPQKGSIRCIVLLSRKSVSICTYYAIVQLLLHPFITSYPHTDAQLCFRRIMYSVLYVSIPLHTTPHPIQHQYTCIRTVTYSETCTHSLPHRHFTTAQGILSCLQKRRSPVAHFSGVKSHLPHFPTSTVTTCSRSHVYLTPVLSSSGYEVIKIALRKHEFCTRFLTYLSIFLDI